MAGTVLENLSGRKLAVLVGVILLCQLVCFLIGGCIAPAPSNVEPILGTKCLIEKPLSLGEFDDVWHIPRGDGGRRNLNCHKVEELDSPSVMDNPNITPNHLVFAFQTPLPKDGFILDYSRWMQTLNAVLQMDITYVDHNPMSKNPIITFEVKLGYRNKWEPDDKWTLIANSTESRQLECTISSEKKNGYQYDCKLLPLFELGSVHHDYYLLNLRLPTDLAGESPLNDGIGNVDDIWVVVINQNGGFTKVWVSLKTFFFPIILATMIWYWKRITLLSRSPALIEKMLLALGIALTVLNLPLEFLTLWVEMPFMLLLSDIRQGYFYASLLTFWLVFCGEHLMGIFEVIIIVERSLQNSDWVFDGSAVEKEALSKRMRCLFSAVDDVERNRLRSYWRYLTSVVFGCFCLFIFDMCERGVQLKNPFFSIWVTELGTNLALGFIVLAGVAASLYFVFLCYMVYKVFKNIGFKRNTLPSMSSARRLYYEGVIYRFKFLMMATLLCAALTVISYIIGQVSEGHWKWDDNIKLEYTSAFFTGVYGMWNLYVFALLVLYAPSHKFYPSKSDSHSSTQEEIEFSRLTTSEPSPSEPTEISALTGFAKKTAFD